MAIICIKVPHDAARLLEGVEVPGDRSSASDMHVTLLTFGKDLPIIDIAKAMCVCYDVISKTRSIAFSVDYIDSFDDHGSGVPVVCPIDSPEVHALWQSLKDSFDRLNIPYDTKWTEFKPHVTLSYSDEPFTGPLPAPLTWTAHDVIIWGGDSTDQRISITIPFALTPLEKVAMKIIDALV